MATDHPRYAMHNGKRVRVVRYEGERQWLVLDRYDRYRSVHATRLTFIPERSKMNQLEE